MEPSPENLKVAVRVRPLLSIDRSQDTIVYFGENEEIRVSDGEHYISSTYNKIFRPEASQDEIFDFVSPALGQTIKGFNCTIFAYGQTGSGKTYTMFGADWEMNNPAAQIYYENGAQMRRKSQLESIDHPLDNPIKQGIIPKSIAMLFQNTQEKEITYYSSFLQIYNEKIYDLLQDPRRDKALNIRESKMYGIYVEGLAEFVVENAEDCFMLLAKGDRNRAVRQTRFNHHSSRSHTIFQLLLERDKANKRGVLKKGKLNFCDLAGSEKYDKENTMAHEHVQELTKINKSLSALGKVIFCLGTGNATHIPYRDSKLTRLLQDSLGVSTRTILIATVSPSAGYAEETISTLKFADRAKQVMVKIKKNEISATNDELVLKLQREIQHLKSILNLKRKGGLEELNKEIWELREENQKLKKITNTYTIEEVEKLKVENKKLRLELQHNGLANDVEMTYQDSDINSPIYDTQESNQHRRDETPNSQKMRKYSDFSPNVTGAISPSSVGHSRKAVCSQCGQFPPCEHIPGSQYKRSPPSSYYSTYRSTTNSLESRISKQHSLPKKLNIRYKMHGYAVEDNGVDEEIKEQETRQKELKQIRARLGQLAQIESFRKQKFKAELEKLEEEKRKEDEELRKRQAEEAKKRKLLNEQKKLVNTYKEAKKFQLEEENKKMQRFKQEAEMKRKKKTEEQKKMIEEYHAKKRDVMRELEEYV
ncbi:unnamed protein product [Blepharisma stoltei]|uniref:Kinesin-like protein n=1 Tax=Blepharisma stoltei TaxID=1481888 RepID=A0AAU9J690_9CILI|nr:unnamed protein product [Blepharisma stoltei]